MPFANSLHLSAAGKMRRWASTAGTPGANITAKRCDGRTGHKRMPEVVQRGIPVLCCVNEDYGMFLVATVFTA